MKHIYIVLIKAHTGLGAAARRLTGYPYTHVAISLDRSMTDFVSFSRRYHYFPFDAGFTHEYRHYYAFGKHNSFQAKIFSLPVTDSSYSRVKGFITECASDDQRLFNLFSMATMPLLGGFRIYRSDNCMSFTAHIVELSGCIKMDRPYWRWSIKELDRLLTDFFLFEGRLIRRSEAPDDGYMRPFSPMKYLSDMVKLISRLSLRMVFSNKNHM